MLNFGAKLILGICTNK